MSTSKNLREDFESMIIEVVGRDSMVLDQEGLQTVHLFL